MKWKVDWERSAERQLEALVRRQPGEAGRISLAIRRFAEDGVGDVKKLQGVHPETWRLRTGDWRVRFRLEGETMIVVAVKNRRDAYE